MKSTWDSDLKVQKTKISNLHDFPTKIDLPIKHSKTIIPSMFKNSIENMCSSKLSKSPLNPEKVQGSTILKPLIKSGHRLPITSIGCRDPSTLTPPDPETLHPPDLHSVVTNLVIAEVKMSDGFVDAQGIGQGLEEM